MINYIFRVPGRPFFAHFLQETGAAHRSPNKSLQNRIFLFCLQKCVNFGSPGEGGLSPLRDSFSYCDTLGAPRYPRAAPWSLPGCFFSDFGIDLCTFGFPRDVFLAILGSICAHLGAPGLLFQKNTIVVPSERCRDVSKNQAEYGVKNFPGNPQTKTR